VLAGCQIAMTLPVCPEALLCLNHAQPESCTTCEWRYGSERLTSTDVSSYRLCHFQLQGYAIGNGVTDDVYDGNAQPEFAYGMGLIDPPTYTELRTTCADSYWNATPGESGGGPGGCNHWMVGLSIMARCHPHSPPPPHL
jgi:hypothetical protein